MNNNFSSIHLLKLKVHIKKLYLKVRFPCSVSFQLKHQLNFIQTRTTHVLTDNIANVNDSVELQIEADYNSQNNKYQSKKLSLVVYMTSTNGKVIAGSVKFDPFQKPIGMNTDCSLPLEKCPDKNAKIFFTHNCEFISHSNKKFEKSSYSYIYQLKHLSPKTNFSRNFIDSPPKTTILDYKKKPDRTDHSRNYKSPGLTSNNYNNIRSYGTLSQRYPLNLQQQNQLKHSHIESQVIFKNKQHTDASPKSRNHKVNEINKFYHANGSNMHVNGSNMHVNDSKSYNTETKNLNHSVRDKKNVERLKTEFNFRHKEQVSSYENRILVYKSQVEGLSLEIDNYKTKMREYDKKEKNSQMMIKELRQEIDKRKSKESSLNGRISELESVLLGKQKEAKGILNEKKLNEEQVEKQRLKYRTEERKQEVKIVSLMQQVNKLEQKYKQSQKSRIQCTTEYNKLLNQLEENQKKQQGSIRDKDKLANQEKSKLNKKIQSLNHMISQLNSKVSQLELSLQEVQNEKRSLGKQINGKDLKIISLENAKQQLAIQLSKEADQIHIYEKDISALRVIQQERNTLKKKLIQTQHEVNTLKQKNSKTESNLNSSNFRISSLQEKLKQQNTEKANLLSNQVYLKRQLEKFQLNTKKLLKQNQSLQNDILQINKLNSEIKIKLDSTNRYSQELRLEFDQKITIVLKDKNKVQQELDQYKWALNKEKLHIDNLILRHSTLNNDILCLNEQLIEKSENIKKLQQLVSEQATTCESLKNQKFVLSTKLKQTVASLKMREQEIYQMRKKQHQLQQELYVAKDKVTHLEQSYKEKDQRQNQKQKQKEQIIDSKLSQLQKAQILINQIKDQLTTSKHQTTIARNQIQHSKFIYDQLNLQHDSKQQKLILYKQQKSLLEDKLAQNQILLQTKQQENQKLQSALLKLTQESELEKNHIIQSLEHLHQEMSKQEQTQSGILISLTLKGLIDTKISKLQIEMIQKRNALILKHKSKVFQLEESIDLLKFELSKQKQLLETSSQENQQLVLSHKEKLKHFETLLKNQEEHYSNQINSLQDKLYQKLSDAQKIHIQLKRTSQFSQEQNTQIHILVTQYESLKQENAHLTNKIQQLKNDQIQQRSLSDSKFNQISNHFEEIISRLRDDLYEKQRQVSELQLKLQEKLEQLKKLQHICSNEKFQKQKMLQMLHQSQQKHQNLSIINESTTKRLKQQQKKVSKLLGQISELNQKLQYVQVKKQDLQCRNTKLDEQLMQVNVDNEKLKIQLQNCKQKNSELVSVIKQKGQTDKTQLTKYLQEVKTLKEQLIQSKSQTDLKTFIVKQHQQTISNLKKQIDTLNYELSKRKQSLLDLSQTIDVYKSTQEDSQHKINRIQNQKNELEMRLLAKTNALESMNNLLNKKHFLQEQLQKKSRDLIKIKDEKSSTVSQKERQIQRLKSQLKALKNQSQKLKFNEDQLKKKNRQLEYLLQSNNLDLFEQKRRWNSSNQKQKQQIYKRIQTIQASKDNLEQQYRFQKEQMQKEIQSLTNEYNEIVDKIKSLYQQKQQLQASLDTLLAKNDQLKHNHAKLNQLSNSQKLQLLEYQNKLQKLKQQLSQKQTENKSFLKNHAKSIENLQLNLAFQKQKYLLTTNTQQTKVTIENIFSKIQQSLKDHEINLRKK